MCCTDRVGALIIDTDVGGDPDDTVALLAARRVPELALVVTSDEVGGERARFARLLLDQAGRSDVPVVAGRSLGSSKYFCVDGLIPTQVPAQPSDPVGAVVALCRSVQGPVRWIGMGPLSNLADVLTAAPELATRLVVTQMGGAVNYRDPARGEHNFRLDPAAVAVALAALHHLSLVTSDVTFRPEIEVTARSALYRDLCAMPEAAWARTLRGHLDRWFAAFHPGSLQHDALTLSAGLELPFVRFGPADVTVDGLGRTTIDRLDGPEPAGRRTSLVSHAADYASFNAWLTRRLAQ